jgi:hypothetical protein
MGGNYNTVRALAEVCKSSWSGFGALVAQSVEEAVSLLKGNWDGFQETLLCTDTAHLRSQSCYRKWKSVQHVAQSCEAWHMSGGIHA